MHNKLSLKKLGASFFSILLCFALLGCTKPGYSIRISIDKPGIANETDLELITNLLKTRSHKILMNEKEASWGVKSFKIVLPNEKFKHIEHQYINFVVEYFYDEPTQKETRPLKKIEVRVGNSWEGNDPILKNEIDLISADIEGILSERFGKSNYSVLKKRVSPM